MTDTLDAQGLRCPLPVLKARKALAGMAPGATLTVLATDRAAPEDFRAFCDQSGHELIDIVEQDALFTITLRRK